jgi:hypothetical protein
LTLLGLPVYGQQRETVGSDGTRMFTTSNATLAAVNGPHVYVIVGVPLLAALLTVLPWPAKFRRPADLIGAGIISAFVIVGLATVGVFFLPSAAALFGAAAAERSSTSTLAQPLL